MRLYVKRNSSPEASSWHPVCKARFKAIAVPRLVSGCGRLYLNVRRFRRMQALHVRPAAGPALIVFVAERPAARLLGLAGLPALEPRYGLLIPRCASVHTFGMRFAIDVCFVLPEGGSLRVLERHRAVRPGRVVRARQAGRRQRLAALETAAGA